jgi:hypothetical protein
MATASFWHQRALHLLDFGRFIQLRVARLDIFLDISIARCWTTAPLSSICRALGGSVDLNFMRGSSI